MSADLDQFLQPTAFINAQHVAIIEAVSGLKAEGDTPKSLAVKLFTFVRDEIVYDAFSPIRRGEDNVASTILSRRRGMCIQKAVLLAALCRSAGIPCKLCFADIRNHIVPRTLAEIMRTNLFVYHGYNAIYLDQKWVKTTPAFDRATCEKHGFLLVEFDGEKDALLPAKDREGKDHIEYVRQIGCFADLPIEEIMRAFHEAYVKDNPRAESLWDGEWGRRAGPPDAGRR